MAEDLSCVVRGATIPRSRLWEKSARDSPISSRPEKLQIPCGYHSCAWSRAWPRSATVQGLNRLRRFACDRLPGSRDTVTDQQARPHSLRRRSDPHRSATSPPAAPRRGLRTYLLISRHRPRSPRDSSDQRCSRMWARRHRLSKAVTPVGIAGDSPCPSPYLCRKE